MFFFWLLHKDTPVLMDQQKTYIHQLCVDTGCHLENLPRAMTYRFTLCDMMIYLLVDVNILNQFLVIDYYELWSGNLICSGFFD